MRFRRSMATISFDPRPNLQATNNHQHGGVVEEIEGLIRVHKNGYIERPSIIPSVPCTTAAARDVVIDNFTNLWGRIYVPSHPAANNLSVLVYFHGGGFCVGSAAWSCYHEFLSNLACKASCVIVSVNYRLAPENRLPAAYDDGVNAVMWVKQQALSQSCEQKWWLSRCNLSSLFIGGDSAGANIAYNVTTQLSNEQSVLKPLRLKGTVLIQPFFGGEARTWSEKYATQPSQSALTLSNSDVYWRLSLPLGANRDHPWCNPLANGVAKLRDLRIPAIMVCVSELDILKDRNLELCNALTSLGKKVETVMYKGVGHAFQVLHNSQLSHPRTQELVSHIKAFINQ
ncbi:putative carboxylesterase [Rosa chinensis]|uniref:Putative carboxylesterase n=1 Tax=Rosa chinensis TaxID=74649 RepID=A0A2P6S367_ROSCH|nr:probable carboxylesterase 17 [Rosa chinensis]PRQ53117.1 putative carboxylesterase [Rosa chinensis]